MKRERKPLSRIGTWITELAASHDISVAALANKVGVSPGTLRYLVIEPERKPSMETCLRLAAFSGQSLDELLDLAEMDGSSVELPDPDRLRLQMLFDQLSPDYRAAVLKVAETLKTARR